MEMYLYAVDGGAEIFLGKSCPNYKLDNLGKIRKYYREIDLDLENDMRKNAKIDFFQFS